MASCPRDTEWSIQNAFGNTARNNAMAWSI
jgi:hypothetical protein